MIIGALTAACAPADGPQLTAAASATSNTDALDADALSAGRVRGTVVKYTMTFDEGLGDSEYFLRNGTTETRLYFTTDPGLLPGTPVRVVGQPFEDGLRVDHFDIEQAGDQRVGLSAQPLINAPPFKARTFGFVLVDIGAGVNLTKEEAQKRLFGTNPGDKSVKQYYNEVSYGTQDITGEVLGPFSYPMNNKCDTKGVASALKSMVGTFDHYLWYMGSRNTACQFSGLAEGGVPSKPTNDTWYNGSANCVVLVQEPGHNFGMMHSSSMTCGTTPFADDPDATCMHNEYGDRYDPMGGACNHMNAFQKVFEGWLQKCNGVTAQSSGMYTLQPLELACDGPQVLQIPMPKVRPFGRSGGGGLATVENLGFYYLELRTQRGFDDTIRSSPTVLVHVAEDFRGRTDRGRHTWILDMDPSTRTLDGLGMGKSYTDPAGGVSFQVMAISQDSATIQVTVPNGTGGATCLDDTKYDPAVPRMCGTLVGTNGTGTTAPGTTTPGTKPPVAGAAAPGGMTPPPRVEAFILLNADTGQELRTIEDNAVLDLNQLPPNLTIRADTDPQVVGSVTFRMDAGMPRSDSTAPYSISMDDGRGHFTPWTLSLGAHTINGVASDAANGMGRPGEPFEIDFMLTRGGSITAAAGSSGALVVGNAGSAAPPLKGAPIQQAGAVALSPGLATTGAAGAGTSSVPPPSSSCTCRVPGAGSERDTPRPWTLAAFALAVMIWRRRVRTVRGRGRAQ